MSKISPLATSSSINDEDSISTATSEYSQSNQEVMLAEDAQQDLSTVEVSNCSDVHFGNKTCYHGPVIINQVLCANDQNPRCDGETVAKSEFTNDNPVFIPVHLSTKTKADESKDKVDVTEIKTEGEKGIQRLRRCHRRHIIPITVFATLLLLTSVTALAVSLTTRQPSTHEKESQYSTDKDDQDKDVITYYPRGSTEDALSTTDLRLISRREWLAQTAKPGVIALKLPAPYVIIMHTDSDPCSQEDICKEAIRKLQNYHMNYRQWNDIGYNFLVGGDGSAYEGRGWYGVGSQIGGYNSLCIGIAFV